MPEWLAFPFSMLLAVVVVYGGARWIGNGKCWECGRLCEPWSVYCREHRP